MGGVSMEWKEVKIGDLGQIITGKTPKTAIRENWGGKIPFLSPSDDMSNKTSPVTARTLTELGVAEVAKCLIPANSICVSCIGSDLGKVVKTDRELVTNQQINTIVPHSNIDSDFVYYLMCIVGKELNYISKTSTAVPIINKSTFSDWDIVIPREKEDQRRIASILSSLDRKIELNNKINADLEEMAQAIFKNWFVDFEPFKDGKFVDSELGMIPEGWKVGCLGDITSNKSAKVKERTDVKVLSPVTTGELVLSEEYFSKQVFSSSIAKYKIVSIGDFAYNPARVNIGSLGRNEFEFDGCVSPVYVVFSVIDGYENYFDLFRKTDFFKDKVASLAIGGVRQSLSYDDLSSIETIIPNINIVEKFNNLYNQMKKTIKANKQESSRLSLLRDTLLPRLMSGELEVPE